MITVKTYPNQAAGAVIKLGVNATFIRCLAGNASMLLEGFRNGELVLSFDGFMAGLAVGDLKRENNVETTEFDTFQITNGATVQTITIIYGDGFVEDNRLVGTVNITGGILSKPLQPDTFNSAAHVATTNASATLIHTGVSQAGPVTIQVVGTDDVMISGVNTFIVGAGALILKGCTTLNGTDGGSIELSGGVNWYGRSRFAASAVSVVSTKFA